MRKPPPSSPSPRLQLHNVIVNDAIQHCWQNRWDEVRSIADLESVSRLDRVHERLSTLRSSHAAPLLTDTSLLTHREFPPPLRAALGRHRAGTARLRGEAVGE